MTEQDNVCKLCGQPTVSEGPSTCSGFHWPVVVAHWRARAERAEEALLGLGYAPMGDGWLRAVQKIVDDSAAGRE